MTTDPGARDTPHNGRGSIGDKLDGARLDDLWDFGDPAGSEKKFHVELSALTPGSTAHAELRTQVARALGLQHQEQGALDELDAAEKAGPDNAQVRARLLLERGRVHNSNGRAEQAIPFFTDAVGAARAAGDDFLEVDGLHMLAIADTNKGVEWTVTALERAEASSDPRTRRWIGSLLNNMGWRFFEEGDHQNALDEFQHAASSFRAHGSKEQVRVADWTVARALRSLGRLDEAMAIQQRLLTGPEDGYVHEELGELFLAQGDATQARPHFAKAAELLAADPWFDEPDRLARLEHLGTDG